MSKLITIPSNPADRDKINKAVTEGCDSLLRMDSERQQLKSIVDVLVEAYPDIPRKYFNKMIRAKHASTFDKDTQENEDFVELYLAVVK